jgi:hypothetical protein
MRAAREANDPQALGLALRTVRPKHFPTFAAHTLNPQPSTLNVVPGTAHGKGEPLLHVYGDQGGSLLPPHTRKRVCLSRLRLQLNVLWDTLGGVNLSSDKNGSR